MDIEAIVKKYFDPHAVYMVEGREAMRAAAPQPQPKKEPRHD